MAFKNVTNEFVYIAPSYSTVTTVVDLSSFRPDAESVRALKFNPQGTGSTPVYDYPDGEVPKDDTVTPELIALRSGRLDKADIPKVKESILQGAKNDEDSQRSEKLLGAVEKTLGVSSEK